ncbi:single-stranded-DNA-specific exonuclease RecJ [Cytobacillus purgationiresistens]|uniref:Single-stranded-DNA-specific exonuclease RecJ n=1 Tax=Cytobacillus purgationiresistens TaxID=863449 RepID=A0ABU0AF25_9BACI|nr:single-stranded-DNA-specific exonuclease RecJ [Cytobacillus purgationiresistens]MDQ0269861.1 single-stranded-DNA-specific exonuclease [Cytobacillus purgationiresistens]
MLHSKTRWIVRQSDENKVKDIADTLKISPVLATLLINRGMDTVESARYFLLDKEQQFHDPFLLKDMDVAVNRIKKAIKDNELILIFGDYDADGVTSTTVMMRTLQDMGAEVQFYIPNRFTEGYGPNIPAFQYAADIGVSLIITVDTGIAAVDEAAAAKELGLDLIITDHHEPGPVLPDAFAIIHPKLLDSAYPFRDLAGVGVAFKLAHALYGQLPEHLLEIAAIGTVADLVPLKGENRLIVKQGIKRLQVTDNHGLNALFKLASVEKSAVDEETIGFMIGPRLNAAGRLDSAEPAVELLMATDANEATGLAEEIDRMNKERQAIVAELADDAIREVEERYPVEENPVIVIGKEGWNPGVIGIVASRLVEKFYRPAIVLSFDSDKNQAKGSARSIAAFDLFKNLSECRDILPHFGGHPMAAGMTLQLSDVDELRDRLKKQANELLTEEDFIPVTTLDGEIDVKQADLPTIQEMQKLAPFGVENPKPRMLINEAMVSSMRKIGSNQTHLKLTVENDGATLDGIGFGFGHLYDHISAEAKVSIIGELSINEWNNIRKPQIFLQDVAISDWQLFDIRGVKQIEKLNGALPVEKNMWIVFNEDNVQKFSPYAADNLFIIKTASDAEKLDMDGSHVILGDLPYSKDLLVSLFSGKIPARIYAHLYKEDSAYFSMMPTRDHFKWYYALIAKKGPFELKMRINDIAKFKGWSIDAIEFMSKVFFELDFVKIENGMISLNKTVSKRDLSDSQTYRYKQEQMALENDLLYSSSSQLKGWFDEVLHMAVEIEEAMEEEWT